MSMSFTFDMSGVDPSIIRAITGGLWVAKTCKLCGRRIAEGRHDRRASIAHLDAAHPGWRR